MRLRKYIIEDDDDKFKIRDAEDRWAEIEGEVNAAHDKQRKLKGLTEAGIKDMIGHIKKDCKPYLGLLGSKTPIFRGMYGHSSEWKYEEMKDDLTTKYGLKSVRQDRQGISNISNQDLATGEQGQWGAKKGTFFKALNEWLAKNGHAERNKSISCTTDYEAASYFGQPYYIFPIGKFKYTFVRSKDFNEKSIHWSPEEFVTYIRYWKAGTAGKLDFNADRLFSTNKNFNEAYRKEYEIWFQCKSYYYIDSWQNWDRIKEWF
jgi:hypothetical protein